MQTMGDDLSTLIDIQEEEEEFLDQFNTEQLINLKNMMRNMLRWMGVETRTTDTANSSQESV